MSTASSFRTGWKAELRRPAAIGTSSLQHSSVFAEVAHLEVSVIHGDPMAGNIRIDDTNGVGLLDFDESRVDVAWHDLSNLGVQVLNAADHERATRLSDAWETANAWVAEPEYALTRLAALRQSLSRRSSGHQR